MFYFLKWYCSVDFILSLFFYLTILLKCIHINKHIYVFASYCSVVLYIIHIHLILLIQSPSVEYLGYPWCPAIIATLKQKHSFITPYGIVSVSLRYTLRGGMIGQRLYISTIDLPSTKLLPNTILPVCILSISTLRFPLKILFIFHLK